MIDDIIYHKKKEGREGEKERKKERKGVENDRTKM